MKRPPLKLVKSLIGSFLFISYYTSGAELPDMCATQGASTSISDGSPVCINDDGVAYLSIAGASGHNSIAISTAHGTGDLNLYVDQGRWPSTASNSTAYRSLTTDSNEECVIISNPNQHWLMIAISGERSNASLVVDFGATTCRSNNELPNGGSENTGTLAAPSNLQATVNGTTINLTWDDNSNNENGFEIQRSSAGSSWQVISTVGENTTTYTDTGLVEDTTYYYTMFAQNSTNRSGWSNTISMQTSLSDPISPEPNPNPYILPDICATQDPTSAVLLQDGVPVCVPAASYKLGFNVSTFNKNITSIAFSTAHGLGNLTLAARTDGWPVDGDDSTRSSHIGNTECVILTQPANGWNNVSLEGLFKGVSVVADFNATNCRVTPGLVDPGNDGYDYESVHVLVYPIRFPDQDLEFSTAQINAEMQKTKEYFTEQSYGNFNFTWEIKSKITMPHDHDYYNYDKSKWSSGYKEELINTGIDPNFPGEGTIIMVTAPPVGTQASYFINSQAAPPLMEIYTYKAGTIAHEAGHALGLHHSMSIEGGSSTLNGNSNDIVTNYGNVFGLMGMGAHSLEEMNLMYKGYFKNWITETDVPTVTTSGKYRIYAFDHGTSNGHNAPGPIGLKVKSGDGDKTYWVEYRTTQNGETNTPPESQLRTPLLQSGILINLQNYMDENAAPWYNHNSLLLDATPNSRSSGWSLEDFNDSPLLLNQTFIDPWNGFSIYPVEVGGTLGTANAWIDVQVTIY
ncbi:fibronectin type III domain-containing protein [Pseudoalteromonas sp. AS84]|uniref:fibronectin type III domain-containing protein n=1 Tax=Pseudoalteromonas sp. AS84 TaxID=3135778 RepID=UPI0031703630